METFNNNKDTMSSIQDTLNEIIKEYKANEVSIFQISQYMGLSHTQLTNIKNKRYNSISFMLLKRILSYLTLHNQTQQLEKLKSAIWQWLTDTHSI